MLKKQHVFAAAFLLAVLPILPVQALLKGEQNCQASTPQEVIVKCTRLLDSGSLKSRERRAYAHTRRGLARVNLQQSQGALGDFSKAISIDPDFILAYLSRGTLLFEIGETDRAIVDLNKTIASFRADVDMVRNTEKMLAEYRKRRGRVSSELTESNLYDKSFAIEIQSSKADPKFAKTIAMATNILIPALKQRSRAWSWKNKYGKALKDVREAISLSPTSADLYLLKGSIWQKLSKHAIAAEDFGTAIRLAPNRAEAYSARGYARIMQRAYDDAIRDYDMAVKLDTRNAEYYLGRGWALTIKGKYDQARRDCENAIRLIPDNAFAYTCRGYVLLDSGRTTEALADFQKAVRLAPEDAGIRQSLGEYYYLSQQPGKAAKAWRRACDLSSGIHNKHWQKSLARLGHYRGKIDGTCDTELIESFRACAKAKCVF